MQTLANKIDALLPQTQCQRCGFDGCLPYAQALAAGETDINRCPPGGAKTIVKLSELTGVAAKPLAKDCGQAEQRRVAFVREDECIGCTKCIQVCPVDAILGAAKQMHTVIAAECTGCELCIPACPVDCIDMPMAEANEGQPHWPPENPVDTHRSDLARQRFYARNARLEKQKLEKSALRENKKAALKNQDEGPEVARKKEISAAIARAREKRMQQLKTRKP